jgi:hypothetical protein
MSGSFWAIWAKKRRAKKKAMGNAEAMHPHQLYLDCMVYIHYKVTADHVSET